MRPDWEAVRQETLRHLVALLRVPTVNPPGDEQLVADYLAAVLRDEGIPVELLVPAERRAAVVARLRGTGARRPVMLVAHMDVVSVDRERWSCDPFGGEIRDGYVYGRGAIDDKGMLAANLMVMLLLKRHVLDGGGSLERDVVFLATPDEESGGRMGMEWLVARHASMLEAEFAINEGGRTRLIGDGRCYLAIQTAEKISHAVVVEARGPAGHAAIPLAENAILRLARALTRIGAHEEPLRLTPTTSRFFEQLASVWPDGGEADAMTALVRAFGDGDASRAAKAAARLSQTPVFNAVLRNGVSATLLQAGSRLNVIPATAAATLNVRTLPGESVHEVVERLRAAIDDPAVSVTVAEEGEEAPASAPETAMFRAMAESAAAIDPTIAVVPYLSTGVTDSARLRRLGMQCYGVLPFPMTQGDEERMHGHDERIPVDGLHFGVRFLHGAVGRIAGVAAPDLAG